MLEREIKLAFDGPDQARAALAAVRATLLRSRRLQHDLFFDLPDATLRSQGCALRLREEGNRGFVTFKGPVTPGAMKVREEHETGVADVAAMRRILEGLGYQSWFTCQKYREEWSAPGVIIAIDETPVGTWIELEGAEASILEVAGMLGRTPSDFVLASYRTLFLQRREQLALGNDMVFPAR